MAASKLKYLILIIGMVLVTWSLVELDPEPFDYSSIRSADTLFELGDPSRTLHFSEQGANFTYHYFAELNRSFVVDDELGEVCQTYKGQEVLSCFPCGEFETSEKCP